jgi:hypothetical protein
MTHVALLAALALAAPQEEGWISLFNGKDFTGWKVNENPKSARVEDGKIVCNGERAHVFYVGEAGKHDFKNFEFKAEVLCKPNSNSGIYFHTAFQEKGWPEKGFEAQVCAATYTKDPKKTGGLYAIKDVAECPVKDDEWFEYHILVKGKKVELRINGKTTAEWTQPDDWKPPRGMAGRVLSSGTFALQCHDPGSTVWFRNLRVKPLPD